MNLSDKLRLIAAECDPDGNLPAGRSKELLDLLAQTLELSQNNIATSEQSIAVLTKTLAEAEKKIAAMGATAETNDLLISYLFDRDLMDDFEKFVKELNDLEEVATARSVFKVLPGGKN